MYFQKMFSNFEKTVLDCFNENQLIQVPRDSDLLVGEYSSIIGKNMTSMFINYDPFLLIKSILCLNENISKELEDIVLLTADFFLKKSNPKKHDYNLGIGFGQNYQNQDFFIFQLLQHDLIIHISEKRGLKFHDMSDVADSSGIPIENDDINLSLSNAIDNYKKSVIIRSGIPADCFDKDFIEQLNALTFSDVVNQKNQNKNFKYVEKTTISSLLNKEKTYHPKTAFTESDNSVTFLKGDTYFLLKAMKEMLLPVSYEHFARAANFFHNYQALMNTNETIHIAFNNHRHKLQVINEPFFTIYFGDVIHIHVTLPDKEAEIHLFNIFTLDNMSSQKVNVVQCDDLSRLFDYVFTTYSGKIEKVLDKTISEMTIGDVPVLIMANF